jgi:hypothetical protein
MPILSAEAYFTRSDRSIYRSLRVQLRRGGNGGGCFDSAPSRLGYPTDHQSGTRTRLLLSEGRADICAVEQPDILAVRPGGLHRQYGRI